MTDSVLNERLVLGTAQFGLPYGITNKSGQISLQEASDILSYSRSVGIKNIDTAIAYGNSEEVLGSIGVHNWNITTKLPGIPEGCSNVIDWIDESINDALTRLNIEQFDCVLLHRPMDLLGDNGKNIYQKLQELKQSDIIKKIGISIYEPFELNVLQEGFIFDSVQLPLNVFDRRMLASNWLVQLKSSDIEIQARSIFLQGILLAKAEELPKQFSNWENLWIEWHQWLDENGISALKACLGFVFSEPAIDKVVIGINSLSELKEIVSLIDSCLPEIPLNLQSTDVNLIDPRVW